MTIFLDLLQKHFTGRVAQCVACFIATFASFGDSLSNVWPAPAIPKLLAQDSILPITENEAAWVASIGLASAMLSSGVAIQIQKKVGSKNTLLLSALPLLSSWIITICAFHVGFLYVARVLACFGDVLCFVGGPSYIGEIAEPHLRGALSTLLMLAFFMGSTLTYYFGYILPINTFAYIAAVFPVLHFCVFFWMPQSPSYLLKKGKEEEAKKTLEQFRDAKSPDVDKEFECMKQNIQEELENPSGCMDLWRVMANRRATYIIILLAVVWQCSGMTTMTLYLHSIVLDAHINIPEVIPVTLFGVVQFLTCIISSVLVDRQGRKPLLIVSCIGSAVFLFALGGFYFAKHLEYNTDDVTWLPVGSLLLYIFFVSIGLGSVPVVYTSELFSYNMQSYGGAILAVGFGFGGLATNLIFEVVGNNYGKYVVFWIFAVLSLIGAVLMQWVVLETKNKSLAEIQEMLSSPTESSEMNTKC